MRDFLSRLSARTLGLAPVARPRASSLFDPGPSDVINPPAAEIVPLHSDVADDAKRRNSASPTAPARRLSMLNEPATAAFAAPSPLVQPTASSAHSPQKPASHVVHTPRHAIADHNELPTNMSTDEPAASVTPPSFVLQTAVMSSQRHDEKRQPASPKPARAARYEGSTGIPPSYQTPERTDEQPTIRVTIGRVEVKATQTAQATQSVQRPASRMISLDDYLKRGSRG